MVETLTLRILQTLQHARDVELDYLAFRLGASKEDIADRLDELVARGVVSRQKNVFNLEASAKDRKPTPA